MTWRFACLTVELILNETLIQCFFLPFYFANICCILYDNIYILFYLNY